jgi:uncharacterized protein YktA (UPF0223 family)
MTAMKRPDLSEYLIHFIKGDTLEQSYDVLKQIISSKMLKAGNGHIKGGFKCICFTEAPPKALVESQWLGNVVRYQPLGLLVQKDWLFEKGGRQVIYGPATDYDELPENFRWRHVRYEPKSNPPIDFTWEREWRINTPELFIDPKFFKIVVPTEDWANRVKQEFERDSFYNAWHYSTVLGGVAWAYEEDFDWQPEIFSHYTRRP